MILIVDDRSENIYSLKAILELHSFSVDTALSGEEALKKTLKTSYELIILDVQMPGMDGFETADFLASNNNTRDIPIIFLSAVNTEKKFITRGYSSGAVDYIIKPVDTDILLMKVKTFHRLYEQNRALNIAQQKLQTEITFREKAQQQIQAKARELNGILSSIPQVAFTATANGTIDFVNDRWYDYAASGDHFPAVHTDDTWMIDGWNSMLGAGDPIQLEMRIARLHTTDYRYYLLRAVPVKEDNKIIKWVGTFTDIEEQKQVSKNKDEFLSIASHELKTPLTSIKGYVQLMEKMATAENGAKNYINRALLQVNKLDNLINDLLDISKIENGKLTFDLEPVDFEVLLDSTLEMLQQIYPQITISHQKKESARILGNADRLEQVIINFVSNAVKYAPDSSEIKVITKITTDGELYFGVQDSGIGISPENQANIFAKFYRAADASQHAQGLGIGLYICAEILKRHNAQFGVESQPGNGSLFYFSIPILMN